MAFGHPISLVYSQLTLIVEHCCWHQLRCLQLVRIDFTGQIVSCERAFSWKDCTGYVALSSHTIWEQEMEFMGVTGVAKYGEEYVIFSEAAYGGDVASPALAIGQILTSR